MHRRVVSASLATLVLVGASSAQAFERQFHAGGGLGVVEMKRGDFSGPAIGAELDLTYGLSDMFNVLVETSYSPHILTGSVAGPLDDKGVAGPSRDVRMPGTFHAFSATTGIAYTLDVLRWIPYIGVLGGVSYVSGKCDQVTPELKCTGEVSDVRLEWVLALGLDYQITRSLAAGLALRWHDAPSSSAPNTMLFQAWGRVAYTWGYLSRAPPPDPTTETLGVLP
jgi:opacity protein-like surface antigen